MNRTITDLIDLQSGHGYQAVDLLSLDEKAVFDLRRSLKKRLLKIQTDDETLSLACALCYQPVYMVGNRQGEMYFRHGKDSGDCPIKTNGKYSQDEIRRMQYHGQKESLRHKYLKQVIAEALEGDSHCSDTHVEKIIKSTGLSKEWRKPDVSSRYLNNAIAFEIQLSTTFLDVIIAREEFYKHEQMFILWVFDTFSADGVRFTEKDTYFANKCNAFVVTDETRRLSNETGMLVLCCHYKYPYLYNGNIGYKWVNKHVALSDLTFDEDSYKIYYFDFDAALEAIKSKQLIEKDNSQRHTDDALLRKQFEEFWISTFKHKDNRAYSQVKEWSDHFVEQGFINDTILHEGNLPFSVWQILDALYALKTGNMERYKWKSNKLIQLSNLILNSRKEFAGLYYKALHVYGHIGNLLEADKHRAFSNRYALIKDKVRLKDDAYKQDTRFRNMFSVLFPELFEKETQ